jgi:two-component system chemotaxis response regulator CheY
MNTDRKYTFLIIDDNDVSRSMLRHILSGVSRYQVIGEASGGKVGLDMMERRRPDIVCLDIHMQDSNGLEILRKIKAQWPTTVVLMVTGNNDKASILEAVQSGATGYLVKPFNPDNLLTSVENAITRTRI